MNAGRHLALILGVTLLVAGCATQRGEPLPPRAQSAATPQQGATLNTDRSVTVRRLDTSDQALPPLRPDPDPYFGDNTAPASSPRDARAVSRPEPRSQTRQASVASSNPSSNPFVNRPDPRRGSYRPTVPPVASAPAEQAGGYTPTVSEQPDNTPDTTGRAPAPRQTAAVSPPRAAAPESGDAASLVLGEGDVIQFRMFGQEDMQTEAFVSSDGSVSLPLIGDTRIGGLTPSQAEARIAAAYREGGYFQQPQVNVTLEKFRSQQISVLGEVETPGRYPLETRTSVLDALAQAEGVKPTAARVITVIRKAGDGTRKFRVDLDKLVRSSDPADSFTLAAGDTVYVPEAELFYIYGEVRRPDAYAIKPGMTVMQALSLGGGLTERGSNSRIEIKRRTPEGLRSFTPELSDQVRADDVIYVKERFF